MKRWLRKVVVRSVLSDTEVRHLLHLVVANNLYDPYGVRRELATKLDCYAGHPEDPEGRRRR